MSESEKSAVTLREHLEAALAALDKQFQLQIVAQKEVFQIQIDAMDKLADSQLMGVREQVKKAKDELDLRLSGMNEFRDTLRDQATRLVSRPEHDALEKRIHAQELNAATGQGRSAIFMVLVSGAMSIVVGIIMVVISKFLFK